MTTPAIYKTRIRHARAAPIRNVFEYRSYSWLVDVDELPSLPRWLAPFARFLAADHFGDPNRDLRGNVQQLLAERGIELDGGRILMLANARVLGYVFNPLSVFWCHGRGGDLVCVIAEVHNTYGERHCYVLFPDRFGVSRARKEFYVSPFNDVSGEYRMTLPQPGERLRIAISLERPGMPAFTASVSGHRRPPTVREVTRAIAAVPMAPLLVVVAIRWQGIRLWARGLPVHPRPATPRSVRHGQEVAQ